MQNVFPSLPMGPWEPLRTRGNYYCPPQVRDETVLLASHCIAILTASFVFHVTATLCSEGGYSPSGQREPGRFLPAPPLLSAIVFEFADMHIEDYDTNRPRIPAVEHRAGE